jgi:hypothetical protein
MTERPGEFRMSNTGIMKNYKLHRYPNALRKPEIKEQFTSHFMSSNKSCACFQQLTAILRPSHGCQRQPSAVMACADVVILVISIAHGSVFH